ncbi:Glycosyltransferase involved in cell wall bisynthesis [Nocardioides alpinus]|uniref:Glycosyltransferase family 1 protein n=1 Tax=Nocardioides alpinus TaxID=748909 RepID=A0A1I0VT73_9ACTN|nr:glycosyltransferase family 4 protein [Nocardioides alpinus]PKH37459.1 glycosyltransferase family 1 protein [Nocardioides alpinus]SFA79492.1 Glycosyltransferase involved in cell wall bisynthesis [Nocardioides alpinus]
MRDVLLIAPACDGQDVGESWLAHQWAELLSTRARVTLLTSHKRDHVPPSQQLTGVRVVEWPEPPGVGRFERFNSLLQPGYAPFYVRARRWLRRELAAGATFDVAHQVVPVAMRYPCLADGLGIPVVVGPVGGGLESPPAFVAEEGATPWYQRLRALDQARLAHDPLLRRTYEGAACVVGIAPYVGELLSRLSLQRLEIMSETAVRSLPAPVDRSGRSGPLRLVWVGRVIRTKGLRDTVRALDLVRDLDVVLDVVGDGNDRAACEELVEELRLGDRVTFHGSLPREQVTGFYEAADVFVFPSYREPGGNVALEAMAAGLPVIVCERGGPGANVDDSCAFRLEAESPDQLAADCAAAVRTLAADPALRTRMGEAGRRKIQTSHLWEQRVEQMIALYESVITEGIIPGR